MANGSVTAPPSAVATSGQAGPGVNLLVRPRLLEQVAGRFERRLTLLCAGAGFGKTTLVRQALREGRLSGAGVDALVTCTTDHEAPSQLAGDIVAALTGGAPPTVPSDVAEGVHAIRDAVWNLAPNPVCIVLDDVHVLDPASDGFRLVADLLTRLPANGHLLVSSRTRPALPVARLVAQSDALALDARDLALTPDENAAVAALRGTSPDTIAAAGGWPALASLITASGGHHVGDFLAEEVFAPMPPDAREVLTMLVRLGGGDDALVSEALGRPVRLETVLAGLPLAAHDDGWWRLHDLWRDALPAQDARPDAAASVATAAVLTRRGRRREAMSLLLAATDAPETWRAIGRTIVETCSVVSPLVPLDVLRSWHARLPPAHVDSAEGDLLLATVLKESDPDGAEASFKRAVEAFRRADDVDGELAALLGRFHVAFARLHREHAGEVLTRWGELADQGVASAAARLHLGRALLAPDLATAAAEVAQLDTLPAEIDDPTVAWLRAHVHLLSLGDCDVALGWSDRALEQAPATLVASVRCERLEAYRHLGRIDDARAEARALDPQASTPRHLVALLSLEIVLGDVVAADALRGRLRALASASPLGWAPLALAVGEALVDVARGDDESAARALAGVHSHHMSRAAALLRIGPGALPVHYVLDPRSRPMWDKADLRGVHASVRKLAHAVLALREGAPSASDVVAALTDDEVDLARRVLPTPWTALIGVHVAAAGREVGVDVVKAVGGAARPALRGLTTTSGSAAKVAQRLLASVPPRPRRRLDVSVLGPLAVRLDGKTADDPHLGRERVRQLIGLLAVRRSVARSVVAAAIWPDLPEADAARNLRVTLNYVQRVLEPDRDERDAPFYLRAKGTQLELGGAPELDVDLWGFHADLDEAEAAERAGAPSLAIAPYERAIARWRGGLLTDLTDADWFVAERELVHRRLVAAAVRLADLAAADGELDRPEALALAALDVEPWSEPAFDVLVSTLLDRGDVAAARRALDRCFDMLDDLGVAASARTIALAERIRRGGRRR